MIKKYFIPFLFLLTSVTVWADDMKPLPPTPTYKEQIPLFFDRLGSNKNIQISGFREDNYDDITFDKVPVKSNKMLPFTETLNTDIQELKTFKYYVNSNKVISTTIYYGFGKVYKVTYTFINIPVSSDSKNLYISNNENLFKKIKLDLYNYLANIGFEEDRFFLMKIVHGLNEKVDSFIYSIGASGSNENADELKPVDDKTFKKGDYRVAVNSNTKQSFTVQLTLASVHDEFESIESIDLKNREEASKEKNEQAVNETIQNIIRTDK